ncbi:MAG: sodium:solute symporter family protein [Lentisphaeraceae bacterium]|nr:sodium:solute symporter family protein [Lentisphaeraceae bacterium]
MTPTMMIIYGYLGLILILGVGSSFFGKKNDSSDYFKASNSIGPVLLLLTVFGTTMTAFALVGSSGEAFQRGIGVYGLMASWSGLVHSAVFFLIGIKLWAFGKRYGYNTQIQFFKARYESKALGYMLFPILVGLVIPYLLIGVMAGGAFLFSTSGESISKPAAGALICGVVLVYVFFGGMRGTTWANAMQTLVFIITGIIAFYMISEHLGGMQAASEAVLNSDHAGHLSRDEHFKHSEFFSYLLIPLSVGMFPHLFQHWLTAKSAKSFKLSVGLHPICIMLVWVPCVLIGIWSVTQLASDTKTTLILPIMIKKLGSPYMAGILGAGILAAIMSSLDSQFMCVGTMFTNDFLFSIKDESKFTDKQKIWAGRTFIVLIVVITWGLAQISPPQVFRLAVWCFSGFAALFPIVFAALYWKRATKVGAMASLIVTSVMWCILFFRAASTGFSHDSQLILGVMPVTFMFLASAIAMFIGSMLSKPPSDETVQMFFPEKS